MSARAACVAVLMVLGIACDDSSSRTDSPAQTSAPRPVTPAAPAAADPPGGSNVANPAAEDASSPKGAAVAFARAVLAGDVEAARAITTGDPAGMAMVDVLVDFAASDAKWQAALQTQFGQSAPMPFASTYIANAESATEEVDGNVAIVKGLGERTGSQLLRQKDGSWKVNANYDPNGRAASAAETLRLFTRVNNEMAAEVASGKHPSLQAALQAHAAKRVAAQANAGPSPAAPPPTPGNAAPEGDGLE